MGVGTYLVLLPLRPSGYSIDLRGMFPSTSIFCLLLNALKLFSSKSGVHLPDTHTHTVFTAVYSLKSASGISAETSASHGARRAADRVSSELALDASQRLTYFSPLKADRLRPLSSAEEEEEERSIALTARSGQQNEGAGGRWVGGAGGALCTYANTCWCTWVLTFECTC